MLRILDLERDGHSAATLAAALAQEYLVIHGADFGQALADVEMHKPAAVLVDLDQPWAEGLEAISRISSLGSSPPVIAMGGGDNPSLVVSAVRHGAYDCLAKPLSLETLRKVLFRAIQPTSSYPFLGDSPAIRKASELVARYATCDYPVLILGESGTGKELAARAIHNLSRRREGPYVARNCAAFPAELIESELFGSARGAYTGATERPGAFELADSGTLFLDEIGEASTAVQSKLLRALESSEVWRLGDRQARTTNLRLISATSCNLGEAMETGRIRGDFVYRINTLVLEVPPLRERREDIRGLAEFFLVSAVGSRKYFSSEAYARLSGEAWPGNVRQLRNVVHRAIILAGDKEKISEDHLVFF